MTSDRTCDVLVVGGGSAGIAAACAAASAGADVVLLERYGFAGGLASSANVGTVCGLYLRSFNSPVPVYSGWIAGFTSELSERSRTVPEMFDQGLWFLPYSPAQFRILCDETLSRAGVEVAFHSTLFEAVAGGGTNGVSVIRTLELNAVRTIKTGAVVDCSGDGVVGSLLKLPRSSGERPQAPAVVFDVSEVAVDSERLCSQLVYREVIRAVRERRLPPECLRISVVPGSFRARRVSLKLGLNPQLPNEGITVLEQRGRSLAVKIVQELCVSALEFGAAELSHFSAQIGTRSGYRPRGVAILTAADVLEARQCPDYATAGAWPIELWDEGRKPHMGYPPLGALYHIPAGCLMTEGVDNLFLGGRNISATDEAAASARVIATCMSSGGAAGYLAAAHSAGESSEMALERARSQLAMYPRSRAVEPYS